MKLAHALVTIAALIGAAPPPAAAQMSPPVVQTAHRDLTVAERDQAIAEILRALERQYVDPSLVPPVRESLSAAQTAGRYDGLSAQQFAVRVTEDLIGATGDGHLYLRWDPEQFAAAGQEGATETEDPGLQAVWEERFRAMNFGLTEQRLLPGNVRYVKISLFGWAHDEAGLAYDDAMRFARGGDAVILDLRGNGGGAHEAVRYVISHFMDADQLLITFLEAGARPQDSRTLTHLPVGRMIGKPLYVLVDGRTASAAEELAYSVQQFGLGKVIGQSTSGGANNNRFVPISPGFILSVSYGRPEHARSGTNWEGVGVSPDVEVPTGQALEHAQALIRASASAAR